MKFFLFFACLVSLILPAHSQDRSARFDNWDKNRDGTLTREELPAPLQRNFDRVDQNKDGVISREEDAAARKPQQAKKKPGAEVPDSLHVIRDINYAGTENPRQSLDLYLPKAEPESLRPLIVFIHGGGWRGGQKESGWGKLRPFVQSGKYAGASIGYRLTDESQWPGQIHDCKAAIRWLRVHADEHGYDADKMAVWGTSAGGHLVAMLGVSGDVEELEGTIGSHLAVSSRVTCVVNFFGPSEILTMDDHPSKITHLAAGSPESLLLGAPVSTVPEKAAQASPVTWTSADDAPSLIVHGTKDELVPYPQSTQLEIELEKAGVPTVLLTVEGGGHGKGFGSSVSEAVEIFLAHHLLDSEETVEDKTVGEGE